MPPIVEGPLVRLDLDHRYCGWERTTLFVLSHNFGRTDEEDFFSRRDQCQDVAHILNNRYGPCKAYLLIAHSYADVEIALRQLQSQEQVRLKDLTTIFYLNQSDSQTLNIQGRPIRVDRILEAIASAADETNRPTAVFLDTYEIRRTLRRAVRVKFMPNSSLSSEKRGRLLDFAMQERNYQQNRAQCVFFGGCSVACMIAIPLILPKQMATAGATIFGLASAWAYYRSYFNPAPGTLMNRMHQNIIGHVRHGVDVFVENRSDACVPAQIGQ